MDYDIVEAAQARGKFFLIGDGSETNVRSNPQELGRFMHQFSDHLRDRMEPRDGAVDVAPR